MTEEELRMKDKTTSVISTAALTVLLSIAINGCAAGHDKAGHAKTVSLDQAPPTVRDAIAKALGDNRLEELSRETEDGKAIYEAAFHVNGVAHSISIRQSGEIIEEEQAVTVTELPPAVAGTIEAKHPGAKATEAELVKADGRTFYEVAVHVGKAERELKVTADGQVLADEEAAEPAEQEDRD
jgi:uncharacterized membrane protein YkoI